MAARRTGAQVDEWADRELRSRAAAGKSAMRVKSVRKEFESALKNVCRSLAEQIVTDGEGVKHVVRLKIEQARSRQQARQIARAIANSPLVKTAWAGADPNWGRMLAAVGYSGVKIDPGTVVSKTEDEG